MRIFIVRELPLNFMGGVNTLLGAILRWADSAGHDVMVLAPGSSRGPLFGAPVMSTRYFGMPVAGGRTGFVFPYVPKGRLEAALRRFRPDVIHCMHPISLGPIVAMVARRLGIPLVGSYHTLYHTYVTYYGMGALSDLIWVHTRWSLNLTDLVLSPSDTVKEVLAAHGVRNVQSWMRGVDGDAFNPDRRDEALREDLTGGDASRPLALYVEGCGIAQRANFVHLRQHVGKGS